MQRMIDVQTINPYLQCLLCKGYLIDATTLVECLHSFCRTCLLKYLESSYNCPKCNTEIHKTKPLEYIRSDPCLQEIVYKLVPDLYAKEENRRFKWKLDKSDDPGPSVQDESTDDSRILVTLKYFRGTSRMERIKTENVLQLFPTRYLCCQPEMPVRTLKKFVQHKFDICPEMFELELWRGDETLLEELTLKQLVQIYGLYRERKPLELHFSLYPKFKAETVKTEVVPKPEVLKPFTTNTERVCSDNLTDSIPDFREDVDISEKGQAAVENKVIENSTNSNHIPVDNLNNIKGEQSTNNAVTEDNFNGEPSTENTVTDDNVNIDRNNEGGSNSRTSSPLDAILPRGHNDTVDTILPRDHSDSIDAILPRAHNSDSPDSILPRVHGDTGDTILPRMHMEDEQMDES